MRWISDPSGRFVQRPWYEDGELDEQCEVLIEGFLLDRHGVVEYPVKTDDLIILIEKHADDLDCYADLSDHGADVQGVTKFGRDGTTSVRIDCELSAENQAWRENRLRTTLTHELGHVVLHGSLIPRLQPPHLGDDEIPALCRCTRDSVLEASPVDWLEWQAGYASGAFLMPITATRALAARCRADWKMRETFVVGGKPAADLVRWTQRHFDVSPTAARVRLSQLGELVEDPPPTERFF